MPRLLFVVTALAAVPLAVAAPVPKASKKFEPFGTPAETKGVTCEMARPGELRVTVSKDAATESKEHTTARPHVARTVDGDFELTVRITHTKPQAEGLAAAFKDEVIASAGLALHRADGKRGSLAVLNQLTNCEHIWHGHFKLHALYETKDERGVKGDLGSHQKFPDTPVYLRLTRKGDEFTAEKSANGKDWSQVFEEASFKVPGLGAVVVGPCVAHNTNGRYDVTFDEYTLTTKESK